MRDSMSEPMAGYYARRMVNSAVDFNILAGGIAVYAIFARDEFELLQVFTSVEAVGGGPPAVPIEIGIGLDLDVRIVKTVNPLEFEVRARNNSAISLHVTTAVEGIDATP